MDPESIAYNIGILDFCIYGDLKIDLLQAAIINEIGMYGARKLFGRIY
ncbi:hypothetical protein RBU49_00010 [Clostridium sp. MB40-C1]|nr:hypothetical protein [Clostridium sp. MB40-C1]WMJ80671.1 hypothetical protein RBU49_00010 [Clostridium sp. MB40-C1]